MTNDQQAIFSQRDKRWARQKIGSSVVTIGGYGCTLTSTARALFLLGGKVLTPLEVEEKLDFTNQGLILWGSFSKIGLKATRGWGKPKEFKKGMLLELDYAINHWVCVESENPDGKTVRVMDPWIGQIIDKPIHDICGYTSIESTNTSAHEPNPHEIELVEATAWVKEHGVSNGERPKDLVTREELWLMEYRLAKKIMEWNK